MAKKRERKTIDRSELERIILSQLRRLPKRVRFKDLGVNLHNGIIMTGFIVDKKGVKWAKHAYTGSFDFSVHYTNPKPPKEWRPPNKLA